jgi:uncharacterized protein (DUF4213/DUF364 family)
LALKPVLDQVKEEFRAIVASRNLGEEIVQVTIGTLSAKQAIGSPRRQYFALLEGREVMIEARFGNSFGQAFTDRPHDFTGSLNDILGLSLITNEERAVFIATLNAVMAHLGVISDTRHCRDEEPEECAAQIAHHVLTNFGKVKVGMIGLQPAILENLVATFGANSVRCTDLNPKNIGTLKYSAEIWDGRTETKKLINWSDLLLVTSSTIVNDTFDGIREEAISQEKHLITFGVTGAAALKLLGLERVCFKAHRGS